MLTTGLEALWLFLTGDAHSNTCHFFTIGCDLVLVDPFIQSYCHTTIFIFGQLTWMTAVFVYAPHPAWAIIKTCSLWQRVYAPMPKEWFLLRVDASNRTGVCTHNNWQYSDIAKNDRAYDTAATCQPPLLASINWYQQILDITKHLQPLLLVINS